MSSPPQGTPYLQATRLDCPQPTLWATPGLSQCYPPGLTLTPILGNRSAEKVYTPLRGVLEEFQSIFNAGVGAGIPL